MKLFTPWFAIKLLYNSEVSAQSWVYDGINMNNVQSHQRKRLITGTCVTGAFGYFYDNPDNDQECILNCFQNMPAIRTCFQKKHIIQFDLSTLL